MSTSIPLGFLHPRYGIAREAVRFPVPGELSRCFQISLVLPSARRREGIGNLDRGMLGSSFEIDPVRAVDIAVGEAAERYAGALFDPDELIEADGLSLSEAARHTGSLIGFSSETLRTPDCPYVAYETDKSRRWMSGRDLASGETVHLPAQVVAYDFPARKEERIYPSTTSGFAAGRSVPAATLSGLLELVERDAFGCHWLLRKPPQLVDLTPDDLDPGLHPLLESKGVAVKVGLLETDIGLPAILACLLGSRSGIFAMGASCRLDPREAIRKALLEASHCRSFAIDSRAQDLDIPDPLQVSDFADHVLYYTDLANHDPIRFLWAGNGSTLTLPELSRRFAASSTAATSPDAGLAFALSRLQEAGYHVLTFDRTPDDIEALGLCVIRVVVPGLHPLWAGKKWIPDDLRRVRRLAARWGIPMSGDFNRDLHPFP